MARSDLSAIVALRLEDGMRELQRIPYLEVEANPDRDLYQDRGNAGTQAHAPL